MSRSRRRLLLAGASIAALLVLARLAAVAYSDYAWYDAQGAATLWRAKVGNSVLLMGSAWLAGTLFVFANLHVVLRSVRHLIVARQVANIEIEAAVPGRFLIGAAAIAAVALGGLLMLVQGDWTVLALARYVREFGMREPSLDTDVALWVARLPLERAWYTWAQSTLVAAVTLVVVLYAITRSLRWTPRGLHAAAYVRRHISILGALLLLLLAWGYRLERLLLPVNLGPKGYFGPVEQRMLTVLLVLAIFTAACAVLVLWAGYAGQTRVAFATVTVVVLVALVLQQGGPALIRWSAGADVDSPARVLPYLDTQGSFTRRAYGVADRVPEDSTHLVRSLSGLGRAAALWDPAAVVAAVERGGRHREVIGGIAWTMDSLGLTAVAAAREDSRDTLPPGAGWVVARVRAAPQTGEVVPTARARAIPTPLVYPGARGDLLVPDSGRALAAPALGRGMRRMANALAEQDLRLLAGPPADPDVRLVTRRDVRERLALIAPIFEQASAPVPIHAADSLFWAVPLYVNVPTFPLSHHWPDGRRTTKYFQHSATALVNAGTGLVRLVPVPAPEPVTRAWMRHFPALFIAREDLPSELARALPIPEASTRARAFAFGIAGAAVERHDPLALPWAGAGDSLDTGVASLPYAPPHGGVPARAIPLVDPRTERPVATLVVTGGAEPTMTIARADSALPPWMELIEELQQALGRDAGSSTDAPMIRARTLLLPMPGAAALVQPAYSWRSDGVPVLARVAVVRGDSVWVAGSIEALDRTLAGHDGPLAPGEGAPEAPGGQAAALYERMRDALRRADWEAFGWAFEALGRTLGATPDGEGRP